MFRDITLEFDISPIISINSKYYDFPMFDKESCLGVYSQSVSAFTRFWVRKSRCETSFIMFECIEFDINPIISINSKYSEFPYVFYYIQITNLT